MRRSSKAASAAWAAILVLLPAVAATAGPLCDEFNPQSPTRTAQIRLGPSDFVDDGRDELRTFVETGSIGYVAADIVSAGPGDIVRGIAALPEISRFAPDQGEQLKGIAISVLVKPTRRPASVVVSLRQVCARHFRNTFLYY